MRNKLSWITIIGGAVLACLEYYRPTAWLVMIGALLFNIERLEAMYMECLVEAYPREDYIQPKRLKFIFRQKAMGGGNGVPKDIVFLMYILIGSFVIAMTWMLITVIFFKNNIYYICFGVFGFAFIYGGALIIISNICLYKIFIQKYKRLTWHNWMYMLGGDFSRRNLTKKIGGCEILSERKKGKHIYMTVRLNDTGEVFSDVILSGNKRQDEKKKYILYEICRVKYVY